MTGPAHSRRAVDAATLWAGGVAAAFVAALIVVVGVLICRGILDVQVLAPKGDGVWGDADTAKLAGAAAVGALLATGLMHLLVLATPRPGTFFGWIMTLATAGAALAPFTVKASTEGRIATAFINLMVGIAIGALVSMSARSAVRKAMLSGRQGLSSAPPYPDLPPPVR